MAVRKINLIKTKNVKISLYIIFVFLVLILLSLFSAANLIAVIELKKQTKLIIDNVNNNSVEPLKIQAKAEVIETPNVLPAASDNVLVTTRDAGLVSNIISSISETIYNIISPNDYNLAAPASPLPIVSNPPISEPVIPAPKIYSNVTSEPFFSSHLIDLEKTNLRFDENVTALTFAPKFNLIYEKDCSEPLCGLRVINNPSCLADKCLSETGGEIFFQNKKINLPTELKNKQINNISFSPLETKWIIGIVVNDGGQDMAYVYLFDGGNLVPLITNDTPQQIRTQYGYPGGSINAGGGDKQFVILYTGYEGLGYLYNNGEWQDLAPYFGLRVVKGGFKAKIIRGGFGKSANWYICSDDLMKPKLIKLWQNGTSNIQGAMDLSSVLETGASICMAKGNREISIARNFSGKSSLYIFKDEGFVNNTAYRYQSINLSDYFDKKIVSVNLNSYNLNARPDSYSLTLSTDALNWQNNTDGEVMLKNDTDANSFYVKAEFKASEADYSPWFNGLDNISYSAMDRE